MRSDPADLYDDLQRIAVMLFPAESRGDPFWFEAARSAFVADRRLCRGDAGPAADIGEILRQLPRPSDLKAHFDKLIKERKSGLLTAFAGTASRR